jgi:uncharacterized protein (DUF2141 family)
MKAIYKYILIFFLSGIGCMLYAQILDVRITNIQNTKGLLCIAIFVDEFGFRDEKDLFAVRCSKKEIKNGELRVQIPITKGKYGISVLDDENEDGKMDYNFLGFPREGYGFSNYFHKGIHKPTFNDFDFFIEKNETKIITVRMKYY